MSSKMQDKRVGLRGTKTERDFREELQRSHDALFEGEKKSSLWSLLARICPSMKTAYVIDWIPEQGEDIYLVLVDNLELVRAEIERNGDRAISVEKEDLLTYERGLSQIGRIKLTVAREMSANDLKRT